MTERHQPMSDLAGIPSDLYLRSTATARYERLAAAAAFRRLRRRFHS